MDANGSPYYRSHWTNTNTTKAVANTHTQKLRDVCIYRNIRNSTKWLIPSTGCSPCWFLFTCLPKTHIQSLFHHGGQRFVAGLEALVRCFPSIAWSKVAVLWESWQQTKIVLQYNIPMIGNQSIDFSFLLNLFSLFSVLDSESRDIKSTKRVNPSWRSRVAWLAALTSLNTFCTTGLSWDFKLHLPYIGVVQNQPSTWCKPRGGSTFGGSPSSFVSGSQWDQAYAQQLEKNVQTWRIVKTLKAQCQTRHVCRIKSIYI